MFNQNLPFSSPTGTEIEIRVSNLKIAMPVEDEKMEGSVSSLFTVSFDSNLSGDVLSAEDLAWVDSCLVKDPEAPDGNWDALRDALLEIVDALPESVSYSSSGIDGPSVGTDIEMHRPDEEATAQSQKNDHDVVPANEESETNNDSYPTNKRTGIPVSKLFEGVDTIDSFKGNPFLPTYKEGESESVGEAIALGADLNSLAFETEPLSERIFKVWDLGVPDEEDELITQLNKALAGTSSWSGPSGFDDSGTWKDRKDESLNSLIAGIADLSLDQTSS